MRRDWVAARASRSTATVVVLTAVSLVAAMLGSVPAIAAPSPAGHMLVPSQGPAVHAVRPVAAHFTRPADQRATVFTPTATAWPAAGSASLTLPKPVDAAKQGEKARAANIPVWSQALVPAKGKSAASGSGQINVRVLQHAAATAAGIDGVVMSVAPTTARAGTLRIGLDYSTFAQAYGGNYGSRLHLVQLPACALTTPTVSSCRKATPLSSINDSAAQTVSAPVNLAPATGSGPSGNAVAPAIVLAATTDSGQEGSPGGSYAATTLKASGSWAQSGSSGSFTYSYPISVPPAASSLVPQVALSYNSGSIDGQTPLSQAQGSWAGDGWSVPSSFIEQSFVSCSDKPEGTDSPVSTSDECYDGPVLTMSLNGSSTSLVWDSSKQMWKEQDDSGDVITHVTNSNNGTGTYNTDYWTVTQRNGTVYQFGRNELPGWSSGKDTTNSVDWEPVYSAHPKHDLGGGETGDPCYSSAGFTSSVCKMAYRWNLDYVTNVHGNAMAYYYTQATNNYGEDNGASNVPYIRDSYLKRIDYGLTDGNAYGTVPNQVAFTPADRCVSGTCDPLNATNAPNWPDVPFDLVCSSGTCSSRSPAFFSTVRLASITSQQYSTATNPPGYVPVDSYALSQSVPPENQTSPTLFLDSITHTASTTDATGKTTSISLPPVTFGKSNLPNRVDTSTMPPLARYRIGSITTETGSVITVTYGQPNPCTAPVNLTPSSNTSSCYPVYWTPEGLSQTLDWFNKYVVTRVTQTDPTGGAPAMFTSYEYDGGAAWHYDDNELVKAKYRTYGQFRGYGDVKTFTGDGVNNPRTESETTYYRGMSRDNNSTPVTLTDSAGGHHDDADQLGGQPLETTTYLGENGPVDHSTITSSWVSPNTASRDRSAVGLPALTANLVEPAETYTRRALTGDGATTWRVTETDTTYDATVGDANFGLATHTYTHTVPAVAAYDQCTSTTYAPVNTAKNLVGLTAETETDSVACGGFTEGSPASTPTGLNTLTAPSTVNRPDHVVSDTRTFYDDTSFATTFPQATVPTKGDVTMTRTAAGWTAGAFTYQTTTRATYDSYGRVATAYNANGYPTTTGYTMNAVGLTTGISTTNALQQKSTTTINPERGLTLTSTDPNGVVTTSQYDALGRITAVWLHSRLAPAAANYLYTYQVANNGPTAVTTKQLDNDSNNQYVPSTVIYDGMLRPRQTQSLTPDSGRMIVDTFYDSRGWVSAKYNGWWDPATTPNTTLIAPEQVSPPPAQPVQDFYTYDGLGRIVEDASKNSGALVSTTVTVYNGDRITTLPPAIYTGNHPTAPSGGGITQTTVTDPLGRTTEIDQYDSAPTVNIPTNLFTGIWSVSGGHSIATTYGYDGHGNQSSITDATGAIWRTTYNLLGQVVGKTDPDAGTSTMVNDADGNLLQSTDSRGKTISYAYDPLDRKIGEYDAPKDSQSPSNQLASWTYDNSNNVAGVTNAIGKLTTTTAYWGGYPYTTQVKGFNVFGESTGETVTIPSTEGQLGGSYSITHSYTSQIGLPFRDSYTAQGGLPAEVVQYGYTDNLNLPNTLSGTIAGVSSGYANGVAYDAYGRVMTETVGGTAGKLTDVFDPHTGRLTEQQVSHAGTSTAIDDEQYAHDLTGDITKQTDTRQGSATSSETQCYSYDNLDRLTQAWTATDSCNATPTTTAHSSVGDNLGSASTYWTTFSYDALGNQKNQIQHDVLAGSDSTTNDTYDGNGAGQPHTLTATSTSGATSASTAYHYDATGNMTSRATPGQGDQTLTWNDADQLTSISSTAGTTSFEYDADGGLLIQKYPGATTLYLGYEQIVLNTTTNTLATTRYYPLPGGGTAVRNGPAAANYGFEFADQHGTPTLYLDNTVTTPSWRQYTPYGAARATSTLPWTDNRGFLNAPTNTNTGLTELGARQYDPSTGRFISLDPILETTSPQQLNGYTYAADNPTTNSDPNGLRTCDSPSDCAGDPTNGNPHWGQGSTPGSSSTPPDQPSHKCGLECVLKQPAPLPDGLTMRALHGLGYNGKTWTNQDALTFAGQDEGSFLFVCERIYGGSNNVCQAQDPFNKPQPIGKLGWKDVLKGLGAAAVIAAGVGCIATIEVCGAIAEGVVSFYGAGGGVGLTAGGAGAGLAGIAKILGSISEDTGGGLEEGLAALCARQSFDQHTNVVMADGTTKPIKDVKLGDWVIATDPTTGKSTPRQVVALHLNQDTDLTDLSVTGASGSTAILHTTQHHPFWDATRRAWIDAANLLPGDRLYTLDGQTETVASVHSFTQQHLMYNLTINSNHTYYVLAGSVSVLVHNEGWCGIGDVTDGGLLAHSFESSKGPVGVLANIQISGKTVTLSDIAVYGDGISRGELGREGTALILREVRTNVLPALSEQGFSGGTLRITGVRLTGPVGHSPDLTFAIP